MLLNVQVAYILFHFNLSSSLLLLYLMLFFWQEPVFQKLLSRFWTSLKVDQRKHHRQLEAVDTDSCAQLLMVTRAIDWCKHSRQCIAHEDAISDSFTPK